MSENTEKTVNVEIRGAHVRFVAPTMRMAEAIVWLIFACIVGFRAIVAYGDPNELVFRYPKEEPIFAPRIWMLKYYFDLILSILFFIFPILYKLVFGVLPLEGIRLKLADRRKSKQLTQTEVLGKSRDNLDKERVELDDIRDKIRAEIDELKTLRDPSKPEKKESDILSVYLTKSDKISKGIFNRANSYLFIGSLIAFFGVLFFYFQSVDIATELSKAGMNNSLLVLEILPRVGVLIFVESIAFFFLRLYRRNMEEFRYYDALTRQRENQYAIFRLAEEHCTNIDLFEKLINLCAFNANPNKMAQGETNSIIEIEKAIGKDSEIFDKVIELVKLAKK